MTFNEQMPKSSNDKPRAMQTMRKIHKVQLYSFELNSRQGLKITQKCLTLVIVFK